MSTVRVLSAFEFKKAQHHSQSPKRKPPLYSINSRLEFFRERISGFLMQLPGDEKDDIQRALTEINATNPPEVPTMAATHGFADIYAKAKIIQIASRCITQSYYESLPLDTQFLIQAIFNEDTEREFMRLSGNGKKAKREYSGTLNYQNITRFQNATNAFFEAWKAGKVNPSTEISVELKEVAHDSEVFTKPFIDVEMNEEEWKSLISKTAIGSKGMASCIYIHILGRKLDGKIKIGAAHTSDASSAQTLIQAMLHDAVKKYGLIKESLQVYLVGGCIMNMTEYLKMLTFAKALRIKDVMLCSINTYEQAHNAIMKASDPKSLLFNVTIFSQEIEGISAEIQSNADECLKTVTSFLENERQKRRHKRKTRDWHDDHTKTKQSKNTSQFVTIDMHGEVEPALVLREVKSEELPKPGGVFIKDFNEIFTEDEAICEDERIYLLSEINDLLADKELVVHIEFNASKDFTLKACYKLLRHYLGKNSHIEQQLKEQMEDNPVDYANILDFKIMCKLHGVSSIYVGGVYGLACVSSSIRTLAEENYSRQIGDVDPCVRFVDEDQRYDLRLKHAIIYPPITEGYNENSFVFKNYLQFKGTRQFRLPLSKGYKKCAEAEEKLSKKYSRDMGLSFEERFSEAQAPKGHQKLCKHVQTVLNQLTLADSQMPRSQFAFFGSTEERPASGREHQAAAFTLNP